MANNPEFPTPNLAALASQGVLLDRMYGHKFCGPSRAAIQSGRNPIHVTVLDDNLSNNNPKDPEGGFQGIPRNMTGVAQKLRGAGYATHMVGKWHCGLATPTHTPHGRGYDTSLNYMDAANDHWTQQYSSCPDAAGNPTLTDLWDTQGPATGQNNSWRCSQAAQGKDCVWEDDLLAARLLQRIEQHNASQPLFLFWSAHTVHEPYEVPNADLANFSSVDVLVRRYYAAMVSHLDGLVAPVVSALKAKGMWENTLFAVTSDNGALSAWPGPPARARARQYFSPLPPPTPSHSLAHARAPKTLPRAAAGGPLARSQPGSSLVGTSGANNFPLRGGKIGVMEGGIRLNAFAAGGVIPPALRGSVHTGWWHLSDWYATFCALAGVDAHDARAAAAGLPPIDSLDMSAVLLGANATSPRTEIVIGSSDGSDHAGNTIVAGVIDSEGWKLLIEPSIDPAFWQGEVYPNASTSATPPPHLKCGDPQGAGAARGPGCLYNVLQDPSETQDLATSSPGKVKELRARIAELQKTVYSPDRGGTDREMCRTGLSKWGGFLGPWLP